LGSLAVATALALAPCAAVAAPKSEEAKRLLEKGNEHFGAGDYEKAAKHYEAGYTLEPDPVFLYAMGQAKLKQGDCAAAVKLYKQFLATEPPEQAAEAAQDAIVFCADSLADDTAEADPVAERPLEPPPPTPVRDEPPPKKDRPAWAKDPLGWSLVGVGIAGLAAGIGVVAAAEAENAKTAATYGEFDAQLERVNKLRIAGGVVLGVGAVLVIGGAVRLGIVSKKGARKTDVAMWLDRGAGFVLTRRF
jgi:tetratricopeptide (TPR) repeat protein